MWEQESEIIKVTVPLNGSREVAGVLPARQKEEDLFEVVNKRSTLTAHS